MRRTPDMFAALKPPRKRPEKLMHVCDVGGCSDEDGSGACALVELERVLREVGEIN